MHFDAILDFWFGTLDAQGRADAAHARRWWVKDAAFDDALRRRFAALHEAVADGAHDDWLRAPRGGCSRITPWQLVRPVISD